MRLRQPQEEILARWPQARDPGSEELIEWNGLHRFDVCKLYTVQHPSSFPNLSV